MPLRQVGSRRDPAGGTKMIRTFLLCALISVVGFTTAAAQAAGLTSFRENALSDNPLLNDVVYNGQEVKYQDGLWRLVALVRMEWGGKKYQCTGVIVAKNAVVTAAHCLEKAQRVMVEFDNPSGIVQTVPVSGFMCHDWYELKNSLVAYDICIIKLNLPIPDGFLATRISLRLPRDHDPVVGVGFGNDENGRQSVLKYFEGYVERVAVKGSFVIEGGTGHSCHGDSGGPAFARVSGRLDLIGILSGSNSCDRGGAVYVSPAFNRPWLRDAIEALDKTGDPIELLKN